MVWRKVDKSLYKDRSECRHAASPGRNQGKGIRQGDSQGDNTSTPAAKVIYSLDEISDFMFMNLGWSPDSYVSLPESLILQIWETVWELIILICISGDSDTCGCGWKKTTRKAKWKVSRRYRRLSSREQIMNF